MREDENLLLPMDLIPEDKVTNENLPEAIAKAMDIIIDLEKNLSISIRDANYIRYVAEAIEKQSANIFNRKNAIEQLQKATSDIAKAQTQTVEVQKVSFEYQRIIGVICNYLLDLGMNDIALTRSSIDILQKYLKKASNEELSDTARKELLKVVHDLKARQDLMQKYSHLSKQLKETNKIIKDLTQKYNQLLDENKKIKEELNEKNVSNKGQNSIILIVISIVALIIAIISLFM